MLLDFLWTQMNFKLVKIVTNKIKIFYRFTKKQILNLKSKKWCKSNQVKQRLKAQVLRLSQLAGPMGKFSLLSVPTFLQSGAPGGLAWLKLEWNWRRQDERANILKEESNYTCFVSSDGTVLSFPIIRWGKKSGKFKVDILHALLMLFSGGQDYLILCGLSRA